MFLIICFQRACFNDLFENVLNNGVIDLTVKLKTTCKHFSWKTRQLVNMNKINQNLLREPQCEVNKLTKYLSCPENCSWYETKEKNRGVT